MPKSFYCIRVYLVGDIEKLLYPGLIAGYADTRVVFYSQALALN